LRLADLLAPELDNTSPSGLSVPQELCLCLTYLGQATRQHTAGLIMGVQPSASNEVIHRVVLALCHRVNDFIKMPSRPQMEKTADYFLQRLNINKLYNCKISYKINCKIVKQLIEKLLMNCKVVKQ
jgi:hypothetical protein